MKTPPPRLACLHAATLALFAVMLLAPAFAAPAPTYIPFQGQVTDQNGNLVADGQYSIIFSLYDQAVGGQPVWAERHTKVGVQKGAVNVFLGSIAPFDKGTPSTADDVDFSQTKYLGITVDVDNLATTADPEMVPRSLILPSFYAQNSAKMGGFDWSSLLSDASNNPVNNPSTGFLRPERFATGSISSAALANGTITLDDLSAGVVNELTGTLVQSTDIPGFTAMENIAALDAVAVTRDANNNARIVKANSTIGSRSAFYGFARAAATNGGPVTVHQYGPLSGFTNLAPASSYFVGASNGTITVSNTGTQIYAGYSMAANTLFVDPLGTTRRWANANYWGDGSDGALNTTGNVSFASTLDGDVVVKQFTSLTINAGHTVTVSNRCRGLVIYVDGNCTINGTLTMTARGANVDPSQANSIPATGIRLAKRKSGATETLPASDLGGLGAGGVGPSWRNVEGLQPGINGNGKVFTITRTGGAIRSGPSDSDGLAGNTILDGTGGGGTGAHWANGSGGQAGDGAAGTCFSGGAGGGGAHNYNGTSLSGGAGGANGGPGGPGGGTVPDSGGGGAGNPGGQGNFGSSASRGSDGTGGLLVLLVRGTLTIGSGAAIRSEGSSGGPTGNISGGGGSGGGRVIVLHAGTYLNQGGVVSVAGGPGGSASIGRPGGAGGAGSVTIDQIDP